MNLHTANQRFVFRALTRSSIRGGSASDSLETVLQRRQQQQTAFHTFACRTGLGTNTKDRDDEENGNEKQMRMMRLPTQRHLSHPLKNKNMHIAHYHSSAANERAAALMLGFGCLAAVSYAGAQGVKAYNEWKASAPTADEASDDDSTTVDAEFKAKDGSSTNTDENDASSQQQKEAADGNADAKKGPRENIFKEWFGVGVGSKYYEGGFEDTMTRREAALILGIRESSSAARIKEAHRKLLILNHPDTGGSTYMAGKINEAKELLMKGK